MEKLLEILLENPETASVIISGVVEKYKPILYAACKELFWIMKDYASNDEVFELQAQLKKKSYDAYMSVGFSDEQAMALLLNDNLRLIQNMKKISDSVKE